MPTLTIASVFGLPSADVQERPLLARPIIPGPTMFVTLAPSVTGVRTENAFADPQMKGGRFQEFETSSIGTGVTIGDYDGDGRPDIFAVSKSESCRLFRNLGDFKFEDVTDRAGVGDPGAAAMIWKQGATFVDVNDDGRLDLYVCRSRAPNLLYINQGDGTFKEEARARGLDVNDSSVMAAFCDYDRDGALDVYITTNMLDLVQNPRGRRGYLLHNRGDGSFADVTEPAGIFGETQSHSATWWDYDNDGWPDLYVANDYGVADRLYHNNRDGSVTDRAAQILPYTSFSSMGTDLGDVNNDGLIDFFSADMAATTHERDQRSGADARGRMVEPPDGLPALRKYPRNALLLNTGTDYAMEAAYLAGVAATDWTWSCRFEDLDNDGRLDLFVTNGFPRDPGADVVKRLVSAQSPADRMRIMYATPPQAENLMALRNRGDLRFESVGPAWGLDHKGVSFGAALGDLDGDGALDLVYANYRDGVTVLRNDCATGHRVIFDLRGTASNRFGVGASVRLESALGVQVRQLVLARGYLSSSEPALHFGLGDDVEIKRATVTWPSGRVQTFENLGVDRRFTITEPAAPPALASAPGTARDEDSRGDARSRAAGERQPDTGQFIEVTRALGLELAAREEPVNEFAGQKLVPLRLNRRGPALAVGDLAAGGCDDVVMAGTTLDARCLLVATADRGFAPPSHPTSLLPPALNDGPILIFDADGDGHSDLLVSKGGNTHPAGSPEYEPELWLGDGRGGLHAAPEDALPPLLLNVGAVGAADFDRDGRLDVFLGGRVLTGQYPQPSPSALLRNVGGRFEEVTATHAPGLREVGLVTAALWTDADNDGWLDLLLTLEWGPVKCFHNQQGAGFEDWTEKLGFAAAGTGWWTSLAAADFNGDGRPDYVAGNVGLNTPYRADAQHPALLYSGEFKGDGSSQLVEAYFEGEKLYPRCCLQTLGTVLPAILKKYPRNDHYARATLADLLGADRLAAAQRFAATELRSGVFLSQPDGAFRFTPLPRVAQIAPAQGTVAGDFDGDGHADIYLVQNSYAPVPAVGRFAGGLSQLLTGDGRGDFTAVPPAESGLIVPGDAKALVTLDLAGDGWPDFLVSRNHDTLLAFRNRGVPGRSSLRVELRGPAGNPRAIGARIAVETADGRTQTSEVYAGSGYYSQSTPACFVGYRDGQPPLRVQVRWPGGATTVHRVSAPSPVLSLAPDT